MVAVTLSTKTSELLSSTCETTKLSVFMYWIADPVDPGVVPDGVVCCINKDNLKVLVCGILQQRRYQVHFFSSENSKARV